MSGEKNNNGDSGDFSQYNHLSYGFEINDDDEFEMSNDEIHKFIV